MIELQDDGLRLNLIIVCIDNFEVEGYLTIGKIYKASRNITLARWVYRLMDDKGITFGYNCIRFITLAEYREQQINSILND